VINLPAHVRGPFSQNERTHAISEPQPQGDVFHPPYHRIAGAIEARQALALGPPTPCLSGLCRLHTHRSRAPTFEGATI
jgi:hypothetical protein